MQEMQVLWDHPLKEEIATQYFYLENSSDREPGGLQSMGVTKSQTQLSTRVQGQRMYHLKYWSGRLGLTHSH